MLQKGGLCLLTILMVGMLYVFPAYAVGVHDNYPVIVSQDMTEYNGQKFGHQICPIDIYNASDSNAVLANHQKYGLIKRIVLCVQGLVIPATYKIMYQNSMNYFYGPIAAACTLAVALWGYLMVVGKRSAPVREAFVVALKIGAVSMFTFMLGKSSLWPDGLYPVLIAIVDELAGVVSTYVGYSTSMKCAVGYVPTDIWGRVDCALNTLVGGIFNPAMLMAGLLGFFVCALISGTFGLFIALAGFAIIFVLIFALLRACYITITAYVALALMAIISPIFITMILFGATRGYFEKWVKLVIGFVLQPIFLFAYLAMMLAAFDTVIYDGKYSVYRALVPDNVIGVYPNALRSFPPANIATNPSGDFLMGQWMFDNGIYREAEAASVGVGTNPRIQAHIASTNVGVLGGIGGQNLSSDDFERQDTGGILLNVLDNFKAINVYKVDIPVKRISWQQLALLYNHTTQLDVLNSICTNDPCTDAELKMYKATLKNITINYLIQLLLSLLIAFLTMYIFYLMLDMLPFIGSGMTENSRGISFGKGGGSMPGNKLFDQMKESMGKLIGSGG